jgi:predicted dehydrogenase
MIRIGCVGSDNSHAMALGKLANDRTTPAKLRVSGVRLTHLYGRRAARNQETMDVGKYQVLVKRPEDMLGEIDAVIVVYRHGGLHLEAAKPFIRAGLPIFVDKPLACEVADARKMVNLARKHNVPITSYSTVRWSRSLQKFLAGELPRSGKISGGVIYGPADPKSKYGGLFFYGIHCVELMLEVFGYEVKDVLATRSGRNVVATVRYRDGKLVTLNFLGEVRTRFGLTVFAEKGLLRPQISSDDNYTQGLKRLKKMFATGKMPLTHEQLVTSVRVMATVVKAMNSGARERI